MKAIRLLICISLLSAKVGYAQIFKGVPPADWVVVEGKTSIKVPKGEIVNPEELINTARQEAIERKFGTSVIYGNFMKTYEGDLKQYEHYVDLSSQFPQGVWKGDIIDAVISSSDTEILRSGRNGKATRKIKGTEWTCKVKGYAQPLQQILPQFEFQILNGKKQIIVQQQMHDGKAELVAGSDSVFRQGDLFITRFRSTQSGHLALFMDNGEQAFRMLPYAAFEHADDVYIEAGRWHSFFDLSAASREEKAVVDELELQTDREYDAIRIYYLFSEKPFTKDFFFSMGEEGERPDLKEGYSALPSITSSRFATWLQQNKIRKSDLQISVVDLVIDNLNKENAP